MPEKVKCAGCGYVSLREMHTRELWEVEQKTRNMGRIGSDVIDISHLFSKAKGSRPTRPTFEREPVCFVNAFDLESEFDALGDIGDESPLLRVIQAERDCLQFVPWRQGRSPKEHAEMSFHQDIELRTTLWQQQVEAIAEKRHQETLYEQRKARQENRKLAIIVSAIGFFASILAAILTVLFTK